MVEQQRQKLMSELAKAEQERQAAADALAAADTAHRQAAQELRAAQAAVADEREARARIEARLEDARERRSRGGAHASASSSAARPRTAWRSPSWQPDAELPRLEEADSQLTRLKADRERLGGVNLQADEDLTGLTEQFEGMDKEKSDVEAAIAKLRAGIAQINNEGRTRLQAAFDTVNGHFQRLFTTLFGGGEARLEMVEGEDPLEGGLEIVAKPPGKKPATLSLLSGGEQSLTAHGADLRRVPHQPLADLRARRGGRAARRRQRRPLLHPDGEDGGRHGDALPGHHPPPDDHGAHEPPVRRHHGREGRQPARLGGPGDGAELHRAAA